MTAALTTDDRIRRVKDAGRNRWASILPAVGNFDPTILDGRGHACPDCGGTDRFSFPNWDDDGGCLCRNCLHEDNGDGIAALMWRMGWSLPEALDKLEEHLHLANGKDSPNGSAKKTKSKTFCPDDHYTVCAVQDELIEQFCASKGVTTAAVRAAGGVAATWPKNAKLHHKSIVFPAYQDRGKVCGAILRRVDGQDFPAVGNIAARKTHTCRGSKDGWIIPGGFDALAAAEFVWWVEGLPDALALASVLSPGHAVITNICGAKSVPKNIKPLAGKDVYIVGDADTPGQDGATIRAAKILKTAKPVKVVALPYDFTEDHGKDVRDFLADGHTFGELLALADAAPEFVPEIQNADGLPEVPLGADEGRVNDEVAAAMAKDNALHCRTGALVRVIYDEVRRDRIRRAPGTPSISIAPLPWLRDRMTRHVRFRQIKGDDIVDAHPPDWAVKAFAARGQWPELRHLEAIVTAPTLLADGSVITTPGYDAETGLLLALNGTFPPIPTAPTKDDAVRAVGMLLDILQDFPFEGEDQGKKHRAAAVAMILTPLARYAFDGPAPMFVIDANTPGTGKGLLITVAGLIVLGNALSVCVYSHDNAEMRKSVTAMVIAGDSFVLLDNIEDELGCAALDAAITAESWSDRKLCTNEMAKGAIRITWVATGNNIELVGDTPRRACRIGMRSDLEDPETRTGFKYPNLKAHVKEHRGDLLAAALTILVAYIKAGRPSQKLKPWGSFEGWSDLVRSAIVWVGLADPAATRQTASTEKQALAQLLDSWSSIDATDEGLTTGQILARLAQDRHSCTVFSEAFLQLCGGKIDKLPTPKSAGKRLAHFRGRIVGDKHLDSKKNGDGVQVWTIRKAKSADNATRDEVHTPEAESPGLPGLRGVAQPSTRGRESSRCETSDTCNAHIGSVVGNPVNQSNQASEGYDDPKRPRFNRLDMPKHPPWITAAATIHEPSGE